MMRNQLKQRLTVARAMGVLLAEKSRQLPGADQRWHGVVAPDCRSVVSLPQAGLRGAARVEL